MEPINRKIEEIIDNFIKEGFVVLDVGCGTGENASRLLRKTKRITGFDINDYVRNDFRPNFELVFGQAGKLPFADDKFDLVTSWDVIEHVEDDRNFLEEIFRVLKTDGLLCLGTPNRRRLSNLTFRLLGKKIKYPYCLGTSSELGEILHLREYTLEELKNLALNAGFKIVKMEGVYLGFRGFLKLGKYKVPKFLQPLTQHLFCILKK